MQTNYTNYHSKQLAQSTLGKSKNDRQHTRNCPYCSITHNKLMLMRFIQINYLPWVLLIYGYYC